MSALRFPRRKNKEAVMISGAIILIFDHRVAGTIPRIINLEDIRLMLLPYPDKMPSDAVVRKLVEERLRIHYDQVLDEKGRRVPARYVAEAVMKAADEHKCVFWKDMGSDIIVGTEIVMLLQKIESLKDMEVLLQDEHGWKF